MRKRWEIGGGGVGLIRSDPPQWDKISKHVNKTKHTWSWQSVIHRFTYALYSPNIEHIFTAITCTRELSTIPCLNQDFNIIYPFFFDHIYCARGTVPMLLSPCLTRSLLTSLDKVHDVILCQPWETSCIFFIFTHPPLYTQIILPYQYVCVLNNIFQ